MYGGCVQRTFGEHTESHKNCMQMTQGRIVVSTIFHAPVHCTGSALKKENISFNFLFITPIIPGITLYYPNILL